MITVYKEKMTFTKRVKTILEEKRSKIVRRTLNPCFNLVLLLELESIQGPQCQKEKCNLPISVNNTAF